MLTTTHGAAESAFLHRSRASAAANVLLPAPLLPVIQTTRFHAGSEPASWLASNASAAANSAAQVPARKLAAPSAATYGMSNNICKFSHKITRLRFEGTALGIMVHA